MLWITPWAYIAVVLFIILLAARHDRIMIDEYRKRMNNRDKYAEKLDFVEKLCKTFWARKNSIATDHPSCYADSRTKALAELKDVTDSVGTKLARNR